MTAEKLPNNQIWQRLERGRQIKAQTGGGCRLRLTYFWSTVCKW